jgi:hypothetical protein
MLEIGSILDETNDGLNRNNLSRKALENKRDYIVQVERIGFVLQLYFGPTTLLTFMSDKAQSR